MPLHSTIDPTSADFARDAEVHARASSPSSARNYDQVAGGGGEVSRTRRTSRGKMLARQRVDLLVDPGTAFLELSPLAAHGLYGGDVHSASVITGVGRISGRECVVVANDATIKGGTYYPLTVKKHLRAQDIARQNNLPCVYMVDSGGAFLPMQDEIFPDERHFGRIFYNQAQMSSQGIPQIAIVMGSCTAGGAYVPAMSDESIIVRNQGTIFLGGPPLVKAATGEDGDGRRTRRRRRASPAQSGVADHYAAERCPRDRDLPRRVRFATAETARRAKAKFCRSKREPAGEPLFPAEETLRRWSTDRRQKAVRRAMTSSPGSSTAPNSHEFKKLVTRTTLSLAGSLTSGATRSASSPTNGVLSQRELARRVRTSSSCADQRGSPLVLRQNITGFMVGKKYEAGGIARDGAKLVTAVATAGVPKFTVVIGGSYGAGNYGMSGRAYSPRFLWMWPNARISVMGGEQASMVLSQVRRDNIEAKGESWSAEEEDKFRAPIRAQYEHQGSPYYATARLWDDGVIDPADTRLVLGLGLSAAANAPIEPTKFGLFRM